MAASHVDWKSSLYEKGLRLCGNHFLPPILCGRDWKSSLYEKGLRLARLCYCYFYIFSLIEKVPCMKRDWDLINKFNFYLILNFDWKSSLYEKGLRRSSTVIVVDSGIFWIEKVPCMKRDWDLTNVSRPNSLTLWWIEKVPCMKRDWDSRRLFGRNIAFWRLKKFPVWKGIETQRIAASLAQRGWGLKKFPVWKGIETSS